MMMILMRLCTLVIVGSTVMSMTNGLGEVLQHPKSKVVPAGVEVTFQCQLADHLHSYWVVDTIPGIERYLDELRNRGFFINQSSQDGIATLFLSVTATIDKNGTVISCSSQEFVRTDNAVLMVIEDPPVSPNPSIENSNGMSILLKWSSPFLWPGYSIDYYNISVTNSGLTTYSHLINATFTDVLVSFMITADETNTESCHVMDILLSAVSSDTNDLDTFRVNGGFIPNPSDSDLRDLDVTVLFRSDRTPVVTINFHLSERICSYQAINYTFIIDTNDKNGRMFGPYYQNGSNAISKTFTSDFDKDRDYSLTVVIETSAGRIASNTYYFTTSFQKEMYSCRNQQEHDASVYKLVMIIALSVVAFVLLVFLLFIVRVTSVWIRERRRKRINEAARGIRSAMVENPIYEGPLYETLDTQFSNVNTISAATKNASIDYNYTTSREIPNSSNTSPTLRYVEQPCVTQNNIAHAHISPIEGHTTSAQCHTLQHSEQGSLVGNLTAAVALDSEEKYMIMTQGNTAAMDMLNR